MENYGDALEYAAVATNSYGTATQKYQDAYMNSIEARVNALTASWQEFSATVLDSDFVKTIVSILGAIVNGLDNLAEKGALIKSLIAVLVGVFLPQLISLTTKLGVAIKGNLSGSIGSLMVIVSALFNAIDGIPDWLQGLVPLLTMVGIAIVAFVKTVSASIDAAIDSLNQGVEKGGKAIKNSTLFMVVGLLISLLSMVESSFGKAGKGIATVCAFIAAAVVAMFFAMKVAADGFMASNPFGWILAIITLIVTAIKSLVDWIKSMQPPSYEDLKEELKELKEAYKELKDEIDSINDSLDENYDRIAALIELKNKGEISAEEKHELALLQQQTAQLERQKKLLEEQLELKGKDVYNKAQEAYNKYIADNKGKFEYLLGEYNFGGEEGREFVNNYISEISGLIDGMEYYADAAQGTWQASQNAFMESVWETQDKFSVACGDFASVWNALIHRMKFSGAIDALKDFANGADTGVDAFHNLYNSNEDVKSFVDYLIRIGAVSLDNVDSIQSLIVQILDFRDDTSSANKELNEQITILQKLVNLVEEFESGHNILKQAQKDMEEFGVLSAETIKKISDEYPELLKYLEKTEDGYKLVSNVSQKWYEDSKAQKNDKLQTDINGIQSSLSQEIAREKEIASNAIHTLQLDLAVGDIDQATYDKKYKEIMDGLTQKIKELESQAQSDIDKAISDSDEEFELTEVAFNLLERESLLDEYIEKLEAESDAIEEQYDKYKELIDIRKDLLNSYASELEYQKELSKKQKAVADLETQLAVAKLDTSAAGRARVRELEQELQEAQEELDEYTLDKAIEDICAQLDASDEANKKFIDDKVKALQDTINNAVNLSTSELRKILGKEAHVEGSSSVSNSTVNSSNPSSTEADVVGSANEKTAEVDDGKLARFKANGKSSFGIWGHHYYSAQEWEDSVYHDKNGEKYLKLWDSDDEYAATYKKMSDIDWWKDGSGYSIDIHTFRGKTAYKKYHTGGFVGDMSDLQSNEEFAKLLKGEFVSTPAQMDRFIKQTLPGMIDFAQGGDVNYNAPLISLECGTVTKETRPEVEALLNKAIEKLKSQIDSGLSRNGFKRTVNKFSTKINRE